jgi:hypothetical protein
VVTASVHYPATHGSPGFDGKVIFSQADLTSDMPYEVLGCTQSDPPGMHVTVYSYTVSQPDQ